MKPTGGRRRADRTPGGPRAGFTLLELTVVIAIISMAMLVAIPRVNNAFLETGMDQFIRSFMVSLRDKRENCLISRKPAYMFVDLYRQQVGFSDQEPGGADKPQGKPAGGTPVPEGLKILDVEFPETGRVANDVVFIRVSEEGYVRQAAIHLEDADFNRVTLFLEPFIASVRRVGGHAGFDT
jgi:prepilin-type N-terminal cleavage/methylation domain-containing protein